MTQPTPTSALQIEARTRNRHYAKAIGAQPGYAEAAALRDKAKERKRSVLFPMVAWPAEPTSSRDLDKYLTAYSAAFEEERTRQQHAAALDAVIGACERRMMSAVDDPDALLKILAGDLDELMGRVADVVARLADAASAAEAINAGDTVAAAWRELGPLAKEYADIRRAQQLVMLDAPAVNHGSDYIDDEMASDLVLRNLDAIISPNWREPDNRFVMQGEPPDRRVWPRDEVEALVWLVVSPAEPWLPTSTELARLHAERRNRANQSPAGDPDDRANANRSTMVIR